ncbi:uncharacterized protein THITE_2109340 [Thermothielavioides terrestris NRRL 8126]|jgi:hypothetical protein|uniref:Uncharacterized protein n=1 Tax=Thermothielavioides terrestris (strain ATCC 38088 / NRRL 8126) TaxID=578455 RepID=G2QUV4_THETT|nr:uncharacterized protein THITE_2109340 [Thermothielavioides terrestris NRRL 8126]AEO63749.1 hypothetical protein THITE_2109340 [Thermothielavioides terrestris NRRL 8126]
MPLPRPSPAAPGTLGVTRGIALGVLAALVFLLLAVIGLSAGLHGRVYRRVRVSKQLRGRQLRSHRRRPGPHALVLDEDEPDKVP